MLVDKRLVLPSLPYGLLLEITYNIGIQSNMDVDLCVGEANFFAPVNTWTRNNPKPRFTFLTISLLAHTPSFPDGVPVPK